jgi:hypothetical protein
MTQGPRLVSTADDGMLEGAPEPVRATIGEQLERAAVLTFARMGDSRVVVPLAAAALTAEKSVRRLRDQALGTLYHLYQLPTRQEVLLLEEQVSALRHRVAHLEEEARSRAAGRRSRR